MCGSLERVHPLLIYRSLDLPLVSHMASLTISRVSQNWPSNLILVSISIVALVGSSCLLWSEQESRFPIRVTFVSLVSHLSRWTPTSTPLPQKALQSLCTGQRPFATISTLFAQSGLVRLFFSRLISPFSCMDINQAACMPLPRWPDRVLEL